MSDNAQKKIALLGGSFNPPHIGHSAICRWILDNGLADEVWVIPCFVHPLGKPIEPFEHRLAMCRLAFVRYNLPIKVLDIEEKLGGESYTLRTIEYLQSQYHDHKFAFVTGTDIDPERERWHRFDMIEELVEVIKVPRGEGSPIPDVSSTEIRGRIKANEPYKEMVENEVAVYIASKGLYRE